MVDIETTLCYSSTFLKCLSFSPLSPKASILQKATNTAHFSLVIFLPSSIFLQIMMYLIQNSTGSYFLIEHISTQVAFVHLIGKVIMYRVNRSKFFRLLNNMHNMLKNGSSELKEHLQEYGSIGNVIYLSYTCITLLVALDYCLMPLFRAERDLPIAAWYPFDYKTSTFLYTVAYFHQISVIIACWLSAGVDVMFGVLIFGCCARCKVIQGMLRELNESNGDQLRQKPWAKCGKRSAIEFDEKVAELVDLHCEVFDSVKDINDIHTYIFFVLFLSSLTMICCAGFQVTNGYDKSINSQLMFSALACCTLFELLFYFVPGEILVGEATAVGMAAYHNDWESMPPKYRYCVLSVILRSAKPPRLEIGRLSPLILQNYASFLATTVSYFTSLRAVAGVD